MYHVLYGKLAAVMGFRFLLKNKSNMNSESCPEGLTFDEAKKRFCPESATQREGCKWYFIF